MLIEGDGVFAAADASLHRGPILVGLFFAVGAAFEHRTGNLGENFWLLERGGNFQHEHLLAFMPVDDEVELERVEAGDLRGC